MRASTQIRCAEVRSILLRHRFREAAVAIVTWRADALTGLLDDESGSTSAARTELVRTADASRPAGGPVLSVPRTRSVRSADRGVRETDLSVRFADPDHASQGAHRAPWLQSDAVQHELRDTPTFCDQACQQLRVGVGLFTTPHRSKRVIYKDGWRSPPRL